MDVGDNSLPSQKLPRIEPRTGQAQTIRCDAAGFEGSALLRRLLLRFRDARSQKRKGAGNEKKKGDEGGSHGESSIPSTDGRARGEPCRENAMSSSLTCGSDTGMAHLMVERVAGGSGGLDGDTRGACGRAPPWCGACASYCHAALLFRTEKMV